MAKKQKISAVAELQSMRSHLEKFDLNAFKKWLRRYNLMLWTNLIKQDHTTQMSIMCRTILNRKDMFNTEAYKKAVAWLKEHNTKGGIF